MGFSVKVVDADDKELPNVWSERHNAVFVVADPGKPFQIRVELDEEAQKNVKATVRVDGRDVGFKSWLNKSREYVSGFKREEGELYQFEFSKLGGDNEEDEDFDSDVEDVKDDEWEKELRKDGPGSIHVEFHQFHKGEQYCNRPQCRNRAARFNPYAPDRRRNPMERTRFELNEMPQDEEEKRKKWWHKQNLATKPGERIADPRAKPRRDRSRAPSRSPYVDKGYYDRGNNGGYGRDDYGGGGHDAYGYQAYGSTRHGGGGYERQYAPSTKCIHMRWQQGGKLGEYVAYYHTAEVLMLRKILTPDENPEHRRLLEESGYYVRAHQKTEAKRKKARAERRRKKRNYEPKIEPGMVVNLDSDAEDDPNQPSSSTSAMQDDKPDDAVKSENKMFLRTQGKEVCDLTRQEGMEVWFVRSQDKQGGQKGSRQQQPPQHPEETTSDGNAIIPVE